MHDLKLDQAFIRAMDAKDDETSRRAASIVTSTIALARGLGLGFIAEGVETATSFDQLEQLGCETIQGYYLSRPLPAAQLADWIAARSEEEPTYGPLLVGGPARSGAVGGAPVAG